MKIAISGKQGSGKSTLAKQFIEKYGFKHVSFAKALKEMAINEYGLSEEEVYGAKKKREFLQNLGAEKRAEDEDYWVNIVLNQIAKNPEDNYVLDDLRYQNELDRLVDAGFITVRVDASSEIRQERIGNTFSNPEHASETELDYISNPVLASDEDVSWDVYINNEYENLDTFLLTADKIYKAFSEQ